MTESMFFVIEQRANPQRRGLPLASMRICGWERRHVSVNGNARVHATYTFQFSVDNFVVVQIV